uniref:Uncharacterized protein n=1 Tax=Anguilla anguilla TaxID=7936 RepID=A0A0E9S2Y9_ANGAN
MWKIKNVRYIFLTRSQNVICKGALVVLYMVN